MIHYSSCQIFYTVGEVTAVSLETRGSGLGGYDWPALLA